LPIFKNYPKYFVKIQKNQKYFQNFFKKIFQKKFPCKNFFKKIKFPKKFHKKFSKKFQKIFLIYQKVMAAGGRKTTSYRLC